MQVLMHFPQRGSLQVEIAEPFLTELNQRLERGDLGIEDAYDLLSQIQLFERDRQSIASRYPGLTLAIVTQDVLLAETIQQAARFAESRFPGRMYYLVEIPESGILPPLIDELQPPREYAYEVIDGRIRAIRQ